MVRRISKLLTVAFVLIMTSGCDDSAVDIIRAVVDITDIVVNVVN
jgi:hypothetical protein